MKIVERVLCIFDEDYYDKSSGFYEFIFEIWDLIFYL